MTGNFRWVASGFVCVLCVATACADDPPPDKKKRLEIVADVTKSSAEVLHRIENNRYTVRVHYSDDIHGNEPRRLRIVSPAPGVWAAPQGKLGVRLNYTMKPTAESAAVLVGTPATVPLPLLEHPIPPSHGVEYRIELAFPLRLGMAGKHFDTLMEQFRVEGEATVKKTAAEQKLDEAKTDALREATMKKSIASFLTTLPGSIETRIKEYDKYQMKRLKRPRFIENRANPAQTLKDFLEWLETDRLFEHVKWNVGERLSEEKILSLGQEIRAVMAGIPAASEPKRGQLKPSDIEELLKLIHVDFQAGFTPHRAPGKPDDGWIDARRVVLSKDAATTVVWSGQAGQAGNEWRFEWLKFRADEDAVDVQPSEASSTLAWAVVEGADGWRYLRMASSKRGGLEPFTVRLSTSRLKDDKSRVVTIPTRPPAAVKFPF